MDTALQQAVPTLSPATLRALAHGALAGWAYLAVVLGTMRLVYPSFSLRERVPTAVDDLVGLGYVYGGVWLVGFLAATLFLRFGTLLPLAVVAYDYLVFLGDPHVGDAQGPLVQFAWPAYLLVFVLLAAAEYGSLLVVRGAGDLLVLGRQALVLALVAGVVVLGLSTILPVWRVVPMSLSLPIHVENDDTAAHDVRVRVVDTTSGETVFTETVRVGAGETVTVDDAVTRLRRYRVVGTLDGEATERGEYVFDPRRRASVSGVIVWVEGELGRFVVIGQGTGP